MRLGLQLHISLENNDFRCDLNLSPRGCDCFITSEVLFTFLPLFYPYLSLSLLTFWPTYLPFFSLFPLFFLSVSYFWRNIGNYYYYYYYQLAFHLFGIGIPNKWNANSKNVKKCLLDRVVFGPLGIQICIRTAPEFTSTEPRPLLAGQSLLFLVCIRH